MSNPAPNNSFSNNMLYQEHLNQLDTIFVDIQEKIETLDKTPETFKFQKLPLARVKKIMKADEDVKMISAEAPVLFAKACEMFIIELTHRSYFHTVENKRKTLQRSDIAQTIASTDIYDFLQDIIPKEELKEAQNNNKKAQEELNLRPPTSTTAPAPTPAPHDLAQAMIPPSPMADPDIKLDGIETPQQKTLQMFSETDPANINQNEPNNEDKLE
ncbi:unnamed protein product [Moneuplotes crassus]|uniref:Transcription factor CBF/NF-Y/archaeal histone domain-containing protein n=1 Tax=Euplotes crassus TaxID=5936 RepID=A0AAD1XSA2_EUPCR|nr:unnamed protein product [Moneuplotes crassus]